MSNRLISYHKPIPNPVSMMNVVSMLRIALFVTLHRMRLGRDRNAHVSVVVNGDKYTPLTFRTMQCAQ